MEQRISEINHLENGEVFDVRRGKRFHWPVFLLSICLCIGCLTGCGDSIKDDTKQMVMEKTDEALSLYTDLEKLVKDNGLEVEQAFTDMKKQLTDMSENVRKKVADTTEEDGQKAVEELDKMIANLKAVKEKVEQSLE